MEIQSVRGRIPEACGDRSRVALTSHPGTRSENAICIQGLGCSVFRVVLFWGVAFVWVSCVEIQVHAITANPQLHAARQAVHHRQSTSRWVGSVV